MRILGVAIFGLIGVFARFGCNSFFRPAGPFPWVTFGINLVGSFASGVVYVLAMEKGWISPGLATALFVGLMGGFTTFSAFSLETARLLTEDHLGAGLAYLTLSPLLGLGSCLLGLTLTRAITR